MQDKVVVVTGANAGLGFELSLELAHRGAHVVMGCRSAERGKRAYTQLLEAVPGAKVTMLSLDVSEAQSIRDFAAAFREQVGQLDILVNNAGIAYVPLARNSAGYESQLATNYLGPFALVGTLLPYFRDRVGARIVNVGSLAHRIGKFQPNELNMSNREYSKLGAYARSKVALLSWTMELDRRLSASGSKIIALAAHPGFAATDIAKHVYEGGALAKLMNWLVGLLQYVIPPSEAAQPILHAISEDVERGGYYGPSGFLEISGGPPAKARANPRSLDKELARQLWAASEQLTRVTYLGPERQDSSGREQLAVHAR